jgi:hypothetical protein
MPRPAALAWGPDAALGAPFNGFRSLDLLVRVYLQETPSSEAAEDSYRPQEPEAA